VVCRLKTVVEKIALNRWITDNLWNRKTFSLVTWLGGDPSPEILQKLTSCLIEWTKRLHRNWLEDTLILQTRRFWAQPHVLLLFGLEACTLNKSQLSSLDYTIDYLWNCFRPIALCEPVKGVSVLKFSLSVLLKKRTEKLEMNFHTLNLPL